MEPTFRAFAPADLADCRDIISEIYPDEAEKWHLILDTDLANAFEKINHSRFLVALLDNRIVGMGAYFKMDSETSGGNIIYRLAWINIRPEHQRNGIGKMLICELEDYIKKECIESLSIALETDKPDFYRNLGYAVYSYEDTKFFMEKNLPKPVHPKVVIGTLFSDVKDYAIKDWFKNVCSFSYPNFDVCMVDNSADKKYHKKMFKYFSERKKNSKMGKLTVLHAPRIHKKSEIFLAFSANELRKYFLKGKGVWMLNLESDVFSVPDIIERLLCFNKPVIGATYFSGGQKGRYPMMTGGYVSNNTMVLANLPYLSGFYKIGNTFKPRKSFGQGIGCTMIHRNVMEKISFRPDPSGVSHYDGMFHNDLLMNGIPNYTIPLVCGHRNQTWDIQNKMIGN